jgi:hypothetical protein
MDVIKHNAIKMQKGAKVELFSQFHALAGLPSGKQRYPLHGRLDGSQNRILPVRRIVLGCSLGCAARSIIQSLYRLSYRGS